MPTTVRFHLDESAPNVIALGLRSRDRDCTTSKEVDLLSSVDEDQLAYVIQADRVLITRDSDFVTLHAQLMEKNDHHPGIIYWCSKKHFGVIVKEIDRMASDLSVDDFRDQLFFL